MRLLVVGNADYRTDKIGAAQLDPFFRNRWQLRHHVGVSIAHAQTTSISEIAQTCLRHDIRFDALFIRPSWRDDPDEVVQTMQAIRDEHRHAPIFFIDPWDQVSSRFFGVLPYVTKLLKYQRLKDVREYRRDLLGGTRITDYLVRDQGYDLHGWHVGSPIPAGFEHRIATGWNVTVSRDFENALFKPLHWRLLHHRLTDKPKTIDVCCHVSYNSIDDPHSWYTRYRQGAVEAATKLASLHSVAASGEYPEQRTISSAQYREDLERARIAFSPFGWGETTWRDYEAVCNDCLLFKPDMSHISTSPDIYHANETYVPLKWDFSDLAEKCDHYLAHPEEAAEIVRNARAAMESYFAHGEFVTTIANLLHGSTTALDPHYLPEDADAVIA